MQGHEESQSHLINGTGHQGQLTRKDKTPQLELSSNSLFCLKLKWGLKHKSASLLASSLSLPTKDLPCEILEMSFLHSPSTALSEEWRQK